MHGIKHGDYVRYQQYCTKRMHRIRQKLKFHHGARFKKKTITPEIISDERYSRSLIFFPYQWQFTSDSLGILS
jgi:hypothetical protein